MGIEKLTSSLLKEAKAEADQIVKTAEWHIDKMLSEEKAKRAILLKHAEEEAASQIEEERKEKIAWAHLESKRMLAEAREDAIRSALDDFFEQLPTFCKTPAYKKFMKTNSENVVLELNGPLVFHCKKGEKPLLSPGKNRVVEDLDAAGGFIAETEDKKVRTDFTLESVAHAKEEELRKYLYGKLFSAKEAKKK